MLAFFVAAFGRHLAGEIMAYMGPGAWAPGLRAPWPRARGPGPRVRAPAPGPRAPGPARGPGPPGLCMLKFSPNTQQNCAPACRRLPPLPSVAPLPLPSVAHSVAALPLPSVACRRCLLCSSLAPVLASASTPSLASALAGSVLALASSAPAAAASSPSPPAAPHRRSRPTRSPGGAVPAARLP